MFSFSGTPNSTLTQSLFGFCNNQTRRDEKRKKKKKKKNHKKKQWLARSLRANFSLKFIKSVCVASSTLTHSFSFIQLFCLRFLLKQLFFRDTQYKKVSYFYFFALSITRNAHETACLSQIIIWVQLFSCCTQMGLWTKSDFGD